MITRIDLAYAQVRAWSSSAGMVEEAETVSGGVRAASLVRWLIDRAVWDAGFVRQVAYALRLGSRVWELRGELRAPRRRGVPS